MTNFFLFFLRSFQIELGKTLKGSSCARKSQIVRQCFDKAKMPVIPKGKTNQKVQKVSSLIGLNHLATLSIPEVGSSSPLQPEINEAE